jgi:ABC-type multidrug transport system fused ATPase/permease subunit
LRAARSHYIHGYGSLSSTSAKLVEQFRLEAARIENRFEPSRGQLLNLLVRQLDAAALHDARADVAHDLFNVNAVGSFWMVALIGRWTVAALGSAPIGTAAAAVEVTAASLVVIHRHGVSTF